MTRAHSPKQSGESRQSGESDSKGHNMNKQKEERQLVLPGDAVGDKRSIPGPGTKKVGDRVVATSAGLLQQMGEKVSVLAINGAYDPRPGDQVIGIITEANTGNWIVDIKAPWLAPLHVSEVPWRVDFGETTAYLKGGDAILCKVLFVDEQKKVQVTLKDRNLMKLEGGELMEVGPVKVARVIGKNGSMLNLIKGYVECWLHVGQNGRIWLNGEPKEVLMAKKVIQTIADEAHLPGVTERVTAMLEAMRPGGLDAGLATDRKGRSEASNKNEAPAGAEAGEIKEN
ncbi:MAG: exosome complex RNA-binding protein Rrp4 [Candidatus Thermoplasmatota archaeon]